MAAPATLAFFGATGGCVLAALTHALNAGYSCSALARTPSKLTKMLGDKGIPEDVLQSQLRISQGNAKNEADVTQVLKNADGSLVKMIIFGIGGVPKFWPNPLQPTLDDPKVCEESAKTITAAAKAISGTAPSNRPYIVVISTTGTYKEDNDVPLLMQPLYHWLLPIPHQDKRQLEIAVQDATQQGTYSSFTIIRPSLLIDGDTAFEGVRAGYAGRATTEGDRWNAVDGPAIGYTISRENVGRFIFEEIISKQGLAEWKGKKVTLTH